MVNNFHQYQQNGNYLLPKAIEHKHTQKIMTYKCRSLEIQVPTCGRVKPVNGISTLPLLISGSPTIRQTQTNNE